MNKFLLLASTMALTAASALQAQTAALVQHSSAQAVSFNAGKATVLNPNAAPTVAVKSLPGGLKLRVTRTAGGALLKQLVKPAAGQSAVKASKKHLAPAKAESTASLYESFEDWDGENDDWVPSNWSRVVTADTLKNFNGNCTWHVSGAVPFGPQPADGNYMATCNAAIQYNDSGNPITYPQDEWLISPEVTVKDNEKLIFTAGYSPLFLFNTTSGVDWSNMKFLKREVSATIKVMVREVGGEWKQLLDMYDLYKDMDFVTLFNDYSDVANYSYSLSLADYVGKKVQVAFRYVGADGNVVGIDAVKIGIPQPQAAYLRPQGAFFFGFSDDYKFLSDKDGNGLMLTPAYTDITWQNTSNDESETFQWQYDTPDGKAGTSNEAELTVNYPADYTTAYNWFNIPTLTASAEGATDSKYKWSGLGFQAGGHAQYTGSDNTVTQYGVGNYDIKNQFYQIQAADNQPLYGYFDGIDNVWTQIFGTQAHLYGIANYFEEPLHPYSLSKVSVLGKGEFASDALLMLNVIELDEDGNLSDTIATAECKGSDVIQTNVGLGAKYAAIPFTLKEPVSVETPLLVVLEGFDNSKTINFGAFQSGADPTGETNGYFLMRTTSDGESTEALYPLSALSTSAGKCYSSFLFNLNADYGWFELDDKNVTYDEEGTVVVNLPATNATTTYDVLASEASAKWQYQFDTDEGTAPDWITMKLADAKAADDVIDGRGKITFSAANLPAGVDERAATVVIGTPGGYKEFYIVQSNGSGIANVASQLGVKATSVGGDFAVSAPAGVSGVSVFTVAGQLVKTAAVSGNCVVPAQDLAHGIYLLRFTNGATVKVVK